MQAEVQSCVEQLRDDPESLSLLVDRCEEAKDWQGLVRVYEAALALPGAAQDPGMWLQLGMLWWKKLGNPDAAEAYFRRLEQVEPQHPVLREFFAARAANQTEELAKFAEAQGQVDKAIELYKSVLRGDATRDSARQALKCLYRSAQKWNALREVLKDELDRLPGTSVEPRLAVLFELVDLYRDQLKLEAMVLATYKEILRIAPDHEGALLALEQKYQALGRLSDLAAVLTRRSEINPKDKDLLIKLAELQEQRGQWQALLQVRERQLALCVGAERRELLGQMAKVALELLHDEHEATRLWNLVLVEAPTDAEALEQLTGLAERQQNPQLLADLLERRAAAMPGAAPLDLLLRAGSLYRELGNLAAAVRVYDQITQRVPERADSHQVLASLHEATGNMEAALASFGELLGIDPGNDQALAALGAHLVSDDPWRLRVARLIAPYLERNEKWAPLARALTLLAEDEAGTARAELLRKCLALHGLVVAEPQIFFEASVRLLETDPQDHANRAKLAERAAEVRELGQLAQRMRAVAQDVADRKDNLLAADLWTELGDLYDTHLLQPLQAEEAFWRALSIAPEHTGAFLRLRRVLDAMERFSELYPLLLGRAERVSELEERRGLYLNACTLAEDVLDDVNAAVQVRERLLEVDPKHEPSVRALARHYERLGRFDKLESLLGRAQEMANMVNENERLSLIIRRASLRAEKLDDALGAIQLIEENLVHSPELVGQPGLVSLLEWLAADSTVRARAAHLLAPIYQQRGDWARLCDVLRIERDGATGDSRTHLTARLAELQENQLKDPQAAFSSWREVFAVDPKSEPPRLALERLAQQLSRTSDLAEILETHFACLPENEAQLRATSASRIARLYEEQLSDLNRAFDWICRAWTAYPVDRTSLEALFRLGGVISRWTDVASVLQGWLNAHSDADPIMRRDLAQRLAELYEERLADPISARDAYLVALRLDRSDAQLLARLEACLTRTLRFADLLALYREMAAAENEGARRCHFLVRAAQIEEEGIGDAEAAISSFHQILEFDPSHTVALAALERLYRATGRYADLVGVYQQKLEQASTAGERQMLHGLLAQLYEESMGNIQSAIGSFRAILAEAPDDLVALAALDRLYTEEENFVELVPVLDARAQQQTGLEHDRLEQRAADVVLEQLGDADQAAGRYSAILRKSPSFAPARQALGALVDHETAGEIAGPMLEQLYRKSGDAQALVELLQHRMMAASDPDKRVALCCEIAKLWEMDLSNDERAADWLRQALALREEDRAATSALERIVERLGCFDELLALLERQIALEPDAQVKADYGVRMGLIQEVERGDFAAALSAYRQAFDCHANHAGALEGFERVGRNAATSIPARIAWREFLDREDHSLALLDALAVVNELLERPQDLAEILLRRAGQSSRAEAVTCLLRAADLLRGVLHDPDRAVAVLRDVLDLESAQKDALQALESIYQGRGDLASLWEILLRELALSDSGSVSGGSRAETLSKLFACANQMGDLETAWEYGQELVTLQPDDKDLAAAVTALGEQLHR